jgi:membrane protein YqaA with SNARE-associated domain
MRDENATVQPLHGVEFTNDGPDNMRFVRVIASALAIIAIFSASIWLAINPEWVMGFGRWGYLGAFLISLVASATIILPAPGIAVIMAMGAALDPVLLGIVAGIGSAFGELSGYIAGASGRALVPEDKRPHFDRIHRLTDKYGAILLLVLAAVPLPLFDFAGIIAGIMRIRVTTFLSMVAVGKSIKYVIMILLGAGVISYLQQNFGLYFGGS